MHDEPIREIYEGGNATRCTTALKGVIAKRASHFGQRDANTFEVAPRVHKRAMSSSCKILRDDRSSGVVAGEAPILPQRRRENVGIRSVLA
jgi:hypothetical protein